MSVPMTEDALTALDLKLSKGTLHLEPKNISGFDQVRVPMSNQGTYRLTLDTKDKKRKDWQYAVVLYPHETGAQIDDPAIPSYNKFLYSSREHLETGFTTLLNSDIARGIMPVELCEKEDG